MDKVVSLAEWDSDDLLDSFCLQPGVSLLEIDVRMGPEKRVEGSQLVHHNKQVFVAVTMESRDISPAKGVTAYSQL